MDDDKITSTLLQYRNTPSRKDGLSPAQKLFGHPIQDTLPAHRMAFLPEWQRTTAEVEQQATNTQEVVELTYNQHARPLPTINVGSNVAIQNHDTKQSARLLTLAPTDATISKLRMVVFSSETEDSSADVSH